MFDIGTRMINGQDYIKDSDPELFEPLYAESIRQEEHLELIASENYTSKAIMEAQGSQLTNKYAEGYPHKRYYGGCTHVDTIENLAIDRAKQLFGAAYANVQPHSGSSANFAAFLALVPPGGTILGMDLNHGGHLTHGAKVNFSGKIYNSFSYGVLESGDIDYAGALATAKKCKPQLIICGFSAFSGIINWQKFKDIADEVGAYLLADMAHVSGLVAANEYPSPINIADVVTSTTHKTLRGPRGGIILAKANPEIEKKLNSLIFPGTQGGPLMHVIAAKAIAFKEAMLPEFKQYQQQVKANAKCLAKSLLERNIDLIGNGTENHLLLVNLVKHKFSGKDVEQALEKANITVNKNSIPNDPKSPFVTSGIRLGTPAVTTRGFKEQQMQIIGEMLGRVLDDPTNSQVLATIKNEVLALCKGFLVYK